MSGQHALLAASKSATWANCHGALALADYLKLPPETPNIHAASGTYSHLIAQRDLEGADVPTSAKVDGFDFVIDAERQARVKVYTDAIRARGGEQYYEVKMSAAAVLLVPDQFGTSDAVVVQLEELALEAHDLKDGNRIVSALDNDQVIMYLLMAMHRFEQEYMLEFQTFRGYIHQPKVDWFSEVSYTRAELLEHQERLRTAARKSVDLISKPIQLIKAALTPSDDACQWCPARAQCSARRSNVVDLFPDIKAAKETLTEQEIGELLTRKPAIEAFFADLYGEALTRAKVGTNIPGFKLVEGRAGNRAWVGDVSDTLYDLLMEKAYEKSLISPTTAEKLLKKTHPEQWKALECSIERKPGAPALVPDTSAKAPIPLSVPEFENVVQSGADLIGV